EMLEQALAIMPAEVVRNDLGEDAPEIARMVPELRRRFSDIGEPLELPPEQQRRYFFNAVGSFVARASNRFPLMLVMDDVHWADEPTLLLIEHMAAVMPELRVVGVGTYRDVELDVPESVRLVVGRRLERLGAEAQKVLAAAAVVGHGFPFALLEEITDTDAGRLLDIVEEAEAARVIVGEQRDGQVHYSFAHELIRQTLLSGLSLLRRQRLHLSVANAIERTD